MHTTEPLSPIRARLFPVYQYELRKFLPMALMLMLLSFCYAFLRSLKLIDMLKGSEAGMVTISWLKSTAITPSIVLFTIFYSKVSRAMGRDGRFNVVIGYFLVFVIIAQFFLLPHKETLQWTSLYHILKEKFPSLMGLWAALCCWPISLFYIHVEIWSAFSIGVLFWTFVNEITTRDQAKRFYTFLSMFAAFGSIVAGLILKLENIKVNPDQGLKFVIIALVILLVVYNWFTWDIKTHPIYYQFDIKPEKIKQQLPFIASIQLLVKSRYLMLISLLVIGYGWVIAFFETVHGDVVQQYVHQIKDDRMYALLYGDQQIAIGIASILVTLGFATPILKKGWTFAASTTPIIALIMTVVFFSFLQFDHTINKWLINFHKSALYLSVMVGIYSMVLIKSVKYILFDSTKEAAYMPLDAASKVYGKAVIDGIGSRMGKKLGYLLISIMSALLGHGKIYNLHISIACIIIAVIILWLIVIQILGKLKEKTEFDREN